MFNPERDKMSGVDKVSSGISTDKYQLFNFLKQKYDYSNTSIFFDNMGYGTDFDWSTYAELLNSTGEMPQIQKTDTDEVAKQKSFMQIIKEIFSQETVKTEADTNKDGKLSADEMKNYISNNNVTGLDGDASNISLNDLESLLNNKNINLAQTAAALDEAAGAGGGDTGGPAPSGPSSGTVTGYQDTTFDTTTYEGSTAMLDAAAAGVVGLSNMTSADIATDGSMQAFSHVSAALRTELQECAKTKEAAAATRDEAAAKVTDTASKELVDKYSAAVEKQQSTQEKITDLSGKLDYCTNESANLGQTITSLEGSISGLEGQIKSSGGSNETEEAKAQREASNNAIRQRIVALQQELSNAKASKTKIDAQIGTLTTALGTAKTDLETATKEVTDTQAALSTLTDENAIAYANAVTDYNTAATAYNSKKSEIVTAENEAIKKEQENNRKLAEDQRQKDTDSLIATATSPEALKDAKDFQSLSKLLEGKMSVNDLDPEKDKDLIAAFEVIDKLTPDQIKEIQEKFGGTDIKELAMVFKGTDYLSKLAGYNYDDADALISDYEKLKTLDENSDEYKQIADKLNAIEDPAAIIILNYRQSVDAVGDESDKDAVFADFAGNQILDNNGITFDEQGNPQIPKEMTQDQLTAIQNRYDSMTLLHQYTYAKNEDEASSKFADAKKKAETPNIDTSKEIVTSTGQIISLEYLGIEPAKKAEEPAAGTDPNATADPATGTEQPTAGTDPNAQTPNGYGSEDTDGDGYTDTGKDPLEEEDA